MVNKSWLTCSICGWLVINLLSFFITGPVDYRVLFWTLIQSVWLIVTGYMSIKDIDYHKSKLADYAVGAIFGVGIFIGNGLLTWLIISLFGRFFGTEEIMRWLSQERSGLEGLLTISNFGLRILVYGTVVILAPIGEEFIFRGAILSSLGKVMSSTWAILTSAVLFALVHSYTLQFIPVLFSGIVLGRMAVSGKNIVRPIVAHSMVNLLSVGVYVMV